MKQDLWMSCRPYGDYLGGYFDVKLRDNYALIEAFGDPWYPNTFHLITDDELKEMDAWLSGKECRQLLTECKSGSCMVEDSQLCIMHSDEGECVLIYECGEDPYENISHILTDDERKTMKDWVESVIDSRADAMVKKDMSKIGRGYDLDVPELICVMTGPNRAKEIGVRKEDKCGCTEPIMEDKE